MPSMNTVLQGDALDLIPSLPSRGVNLVLTSPPYAMQRKRQYGGVAEREYPTWMCPVMEAIRPKLKDDGSVLIVMRPHIRDGVVSDYVLRTRLALREDGWCECEELIWRKPDAPPLGSRHRPRRTWEQVLWFSETPMPFIDLCANGGFSDRIGFVGSHRFRNHKNPIATKRPSLLQNGQSRTADHFTAFVSDIEKGIMHPAMFPVSLCEKLIRTFSREGDLVCDPFCGGGTTLLAAQTLHRKFAGFDINAKYVQIAKERLQAGSPEMQLHADLNVTSSQRMVRLKTDFPQLPRLRRAFLLAQGMTLSDVRIFEHLLRQTVFGPEHRPSATLSINCIATDSGLSRSTAIRSLRRQVASVPDVQNDVLIAPPMGYCVSSAYRV
jgi:site-specific DNA-methyltransferase (adenine-specific)